MPAPDLQTCPACGRHNASATVFCHKCVAPLRVKKLADLDADDFRLCAAALAETLSPPTEPSDADLDIGAETLALLEAYLNLYWLRPETALWQTLDARAVGRWQVDQVKAPLLDLGCGDGTHVATMLGTRFAESFDVFSGLHLEGRDIFDAFDESEYRPAVTHRGEQCAYGIDIRPNMVRRAAALGVCEKALVGDATALPFPDTCIKTIYSNLVRDFPDATCHAALSEISRVLMPGGQLILPACTPTWRDSLYFYPRARALAAAGDLPSSRRMADLDRGRSISFAQQKSLQQWGGLLAAHGLEIVEQQRTHSRATARFWDVGLRPFVVPLLRWLARLDATARLAVKHAFVATLREPLVRLLAVAPAEDCPHVMYLVRKGAS